MTFVDNGNGTGTLSGTPAAGTGGTLRDHVHRHEQRRRHRRPGLHADGERCAGDHQREHDDVHGGQRRARSRSPPIGSPTPAISVTGALPAGVTFVDNGNGTGTLSGTPAAGTGGTYAITFTAANGVLPNGTQAFTLNVNQAPAITSAASTTFTVGAAGSFTVTTSGFPAPTVTHRRRRAAGGHHVRRQRQRHRHAERDARRRHRRHLRDHLHRHEHGRRHARSRPSRSP